MHGAIEQRIREGYYSFFGSWWIRSWMSNYLRRIRALWLIVLFPEEFFLGTMEQLTTGQRNRPNSRRRLRTYRSGNDSNVASRHRLQCKLKASKKIIRRILGSFSPTGNPVGCIVADQCTAHLFRLSLKYTMELDTFKTEYFSVIGALSERLDEMNRVISLAESESEA
ncbi:hypothetical protein TELCIR_12522 [Teladorsagia circumcincta]|uniref:Uncharacterized protein n=1 Tax=Teladorsagia circumcincta TaxID=45464 RepID=A0A2G9U6B1_TELCI|nr:hypothetical protein TELCIR_12522 [Teladorsagia circumcincta]